MPISGGRLLMTGAIAAVVAALIAGIIAVGPPSRARERKLDALRVGDLAALERLIANFARVHSSLPQDLAALANESGYSIPRSDPESGRPYQYQALSSDHYRLCARFATRSTRESTENAYLPGDTWSHGAGDQCFNRRVELGSGNNR